MSRTEKDPPVLEHRDADHWLRVEGWGVDGVRVRAGRGPLLEVPGALLDGGGTAAVTGESAGGRWLTSGNLRVELSPAGLLRFSRVDDGTELLAEVPGHFAWPGPRLFAAAGDGAYRLEQRFRAYPGERLYGLGQHQHGRLNQKGMVLDLVQRNGEVSIPFLLSSRGYGLLWNLPAVGRVELAENGTRWVADAARQLDYWVTAGDDPAAVLRHYADATGHPPLLPSWATGLWQSKLRYRTRAELVEVAREYHRRGLPLEVITVDYYHWPRLGDWRFDPADWPDPAGMVAELAALGVRLMVSVWPSLSPLSENYPPMRDAGLLVGNEQGLTSHHLFPDKGFHGHPLPVTFYDATDPQARDFVWARVKQNYYDHGVRVWWLDGCEPEMYPEQFANLRYRAGPGREVANLYPLEHARGFYEHLRAEGETDVVSLSRSAWAGSQRYGVLLWSGDVAATFEALGAQVRAGLNAALSGMAWWTTDVGGFHGGDPDDPAYRELLVRWFQYAVFCPVLRMHGHREPREGFGAGHTGGPNELWSYGDRAYAVLAGQLALRERLRPYLDAQFRVAAQTGLAPMRPLFVDFPQDGASWPVEDQFLLGPDLLVAPVLAAGGRERAVYLPAGVSWIETGTGEKQSGGQWVTVAAPLERIPVFCREGAAVSAVWDL